MKLVTPAQDPWRTQEGEDGPRPHPAQVDRALLSLEQWHAVRAHWPHSLSVGVMVGNDVDIATLADDAARLKLIALQFPKWTDGRAYTQARTLRKRLGFTGELRATGDVVVDMLPLLHRTGFDAAVLRGDQVRSTVERTMQAFSAHYQADVHEAKPLYARSGSTIETSTPQAEAKHVGH